MISILMPVKNAAPYLGECLDSILGQSFADFELIAVDDGSSDASSAILKSVADPRVKVFPNEGRGIIDALALAFSRSRGDYIHRMDADDVMPVHKLAVLHSLMSGTAGRVVATGKVRYISDTPVSDGYKRYETWINDLGEGDASGYRTQIYRECVVASPNWLVPRACFETDIPLTSLNYPEDYDLVLRWHSLGYTIRCAGEVTHLWREHPGRTSRNSLVYEQTSFFRLKTGYFLSNEIRDESLQLIGASDKGRLVADILAEHGREFEWFDLRERRLQDGRYVNDVLRISSSVRTILAAWPLKPARQADIKAFLQQKGFEFGRNVWLF